MVYATRVCSFDNTQTHRRGALIVKRFEILARNRPWEPHYYLVDRINLYKIY